MSKTMDGTPRSWNDPLPRPLHEKLDLPEDQHLTYWYQVLRDFDWAASRIQSKLLYTNRTKQSLEGEAPA